MGRVTLFTREACPFCVAVLDVLSAAILQALRKLAAVPGDADFGLFGLELRVVDVTADLARARQCQRLSGASTVPQVFLDGAHVGDCGATEGLFRSGSLVARLVALARAPHAAFPPSPDADLVKVTPDMAFCAQLAAGQLPSLRAQGLRTLISLIHPAEPGYRAEDGESAAAAGLAYLALPPRGAPVIGTGIVASRLPASWPQHHATDCAVCAAGSGMRGSGAATPRAAERRLIGHAGGGHLGSACGSSYYSAHHHQRAMWEVERRLETLPEIAETGQDALPLSPTSPAADEPPSSRPPLPPPPPLLQLLAAQPVHSPSHSPRFARGSPPSSSPPALSLHRQSADYDAAEEEAHSEARRSSNAEEHEGSGGWGGIDSPPCDVSQSSQTSLGRFSVIEASQASYGRAAAMEAASTLSWGRASQRAARRAADAAPGAGSASSGAVPAVWPLASRRWPQPPPPRPSARRGRPSLPAWPGA